ncbi:copper amine oxidase N-terminal domain-containing protein [Biomaibacter acetigenes]|uniref:Copper amine oxidase N-terminal domain-containing protein n=1 Tax=Biomaibacter acetigenes TaxID=2316383 RepID=A0A3G2R991_9FIRM|nr:copper amine oxidase N-terminal domain-containing protein [Biomaibacter acetigenes]AYO31959.1 copper amine oxidase N-terminal domain-containing protein [Biomaibacter acetigenes]
MKRKFYILFAALIAGVFIFTSAAMAAGGNMKNIKAYFSGIRIYVDGKQQAATPEPFVYDNVTYVPIRLVSTALGASVSWDAAKNAVVINSKAEANQVLQQQIADLKSQLSQKDSQITQLTQQNSYLHIRIIDLEATLKKQQEENKSDPSGDLEDYLYDEYSKWKSMEFDYDVVGDEKELELTIEIDLSDYKSKWNSTDQDDIEDWLNDIYDYVEDEYPDTDFSGTIEDIDKGDTLVKFKSSGSKLTVDFRYSSVDFDELENDLNDIYGYNLDDYNDNFGNMTADISIDGDEDDEEIFITIEIDTSYYGYEWEDVKETDDAEEWIEDIVDYVLDYYDNYDVSGEVINQDGDTMASFDVSSSGKVTFDWDYSY